MTVNECARNMTPKDFLSRIITPYQPCVFRGLLDLDKLRGEEDLASKAIEEPAVTKQLLSLESVSVRQNQKKRPAHVGKSDKLTCQVKGVKNMVVVPPWDRLYVRAGEDGVKPH